MPTRFIFARPQEYLCNGGFRMGITCIPLADSFRYLAKLIQYCKV